MDNLKRSIKRLVTRLTIFSLVVVCGAIAIAQAQREKQTANSSEPSLAVPEPVSGTASGPTTNSTAAVHDIQNMGSWNTSRQLPSEPAPAEVFRDEHVQPAQAAFDSRFAEDSGFVPPEADANPAHDNFHQYAQDAAPPESLGPDALEAPPLLDAGVDDIGPPEFADEVPADAGELPPTSDGQFADAGNSGTTGRFPQNPALANDRFGGPATPATTQTSDATFRDPPTASEPGNEFAGDFSNDRFGGAAGEPRFTNNPMRSASDDLPSPAQAEPVSEPTEFNNDASYGLQEQPAYDDGQSFDNSPGIGSSDSIADDSAGSPAGTGRPGPRELEGPQSPSLAIRKLAPTDLRVGQPATFQVQVRNVGQVPAERVLIRDEIPIGTQLVDTNPQATTTAEGGVLWQLGTLRPGDDVTVSMQVTPTEEGPVGSVATVTFQASASARANATKPMLEIEHTAPREVLLGERVAFTIRLSNPGSGPATQVVLEEDVPEGLTHAQGPQLEYEVGTIPAGGTRRLELSLKAAKPGTVDNVIKARGEGGLLAEHRLQLAVVAPDLRVKIDGPSRRYLERKATFSLAIENPGTAPAQNVELTTRLPQGLKFVSTNNNGRYDAATNTIQWSLDRLPAGQFGEVKFTAIPSAMGAYDIRAEATADMGLKHEQNHQMQVEGIAALLFSVVDQVDPIEIGGSTSYEIRIKNQGTKDATNVRFAALVPPGLRATAGDGPTNVNIDGDRVISDAIARLPAKGESIYTIRVEGVQAGDQRFRVQMASDQTSTPVVKEESTRVYAD